MPQAEGPTAEEISHAEFGADDLEPAEEVSVRRPEPRTTFALRLDAESIEELRKVADRLGTRPTQLARKWLTERLEWERLRQQGPEMVGSLTAPSADHPVIATIIQSTAQAVSADLHAAILRELRAASGVVSRAVPSILNQPVGSTIAESRGQKVLRASAHDNLEVDLDWQGTATLLGVDLIEFGRGHLNFRRYSDVFTGEASVELVTAEGRVIVEWNGLLMGQRTGRRFSAHLTGVGYARPALSLAELESIAPQLASLRPTLTVVMDIVNDHGFYHWRLSEWNMPEDLGLDHAP